MNHSPLEALAYLRPEVPADDPAPRVQLSAEDSPVLRRTAEGLLTAYLWDEGTHFTYVQEKHLQSTGIDADRLHVQAVQNLMQVADGKLRVQAIGAAWMLLFDGNFEASLMLVDDLWGDALAEYHSGDPVIAVPARDVLCFCCASSRDGVAELRSIVQRVWREGEKLLSDRLFIRHDGSWVLFGGA